MALPPDRPASVKATPAKPAPAKPAPARPAAPSPARPTPALELAEAAVETEEEAGEMDSAESVPTPLPTPRPARIGAPDPAGLAQPVLRVRGVGPKLTELLHKLGLQTINDLLTFYPRRYDDFTLLKPIQRLTYGEIVTVIGTVWDVRSRRTRTNGLAIHAVIGDGTGKIQAIWYNQAWLMNKLKAGMPIALSGKVEQYLGQPVFNAPEWEPLTEELLRTQRILPVYSLTKGLAMFKLRQIMQEAVEQWAPHVPDPLPDAIRERHQFLALPEAVWQIHLPDTQTELHRARQRLIFDELLWLQLGMLSQRREWRQNPAQPCPPAAAAQAQFLAGLPFALTGAQQRVVGEIEADMARAVPMTRLLQGDVGSGKTVVAAAGMVQAGAADAEAGLVGASGILAGGDIKGMGRVDGAD